MPVSNVDILKRAVVPDGNDPIAQQNRCVRNVCTAAVKDLYRERQAGRLARHAHVARPVKAGKVPAVCPSQSGPDESGQDQRDVQSPAISEILAVPTSSSCAL